MPSGSQLAAPLSQREASLLVTRVIRGTVTILLVAVAAALVASVLAGLLGHGLIVVQGGSMGEALPGGSLVVTRWVAADELVPGDVIVVRERPQEGQATSPVIHRIVSIRGEEGRIVVRTKGDANGAPDPNPHVLPDRVATPALSLPLLGFLVAALRTPVGFVLFVVLPGAWLSILALWDIWSGGRPEPRRGGFADDHGFA